MKASPDAPGRALVGAAQMRALLLRCLRLLIRDQVPEVVLPRLGALSGMGLAPTMAIRTQPGISMGRRAVTML